MIYLFHKERVAISLDGEMAWAQVAGVWLDIVRYVTATVAVGASVQPIGSILVLALLTMPAAAASLLTDRLGLVMLVLVIGGCT